MLARVLCAPPPPRRQGRLVAGHAGLRQFLSYSTVSTTVSYERHAGVSRSARTPATLAVTFVSPSHIPPRCIRTYFDELVRHRAPAAATATQPTRMTAGSHAPAAAATTVACAEVAAPMMPQAK